MINYSWYTIGAPTWLWVNPVSPPSDAGEDKGYLWNEATKTWDAA